MIQKPPSIENDAFKSAKWDELTQGRDFDAAAVPTLELLCQWYAIVQKCIDDIDDLNGQVAYQNNIGDIKPLLQIATMKQASAEIRQLSKQLGISGEASGETPNQKATILEIIQGNRAQKAKNREARTAV